MLSMDEAEAAERTDEEEDAAVKERTTTRALKQAKVVAEVADAAEAANELSLKTRTLRAGRPQCQMTGSASLLW